MGESVSTFRRKCKGRCSISRKDEILTTALEVLHTPVIKAIEAYAEGLARLKELVPMEVPPPVSNKVIETLTLVGVLPPIKGE